MRWELWGKMKEGEVGDRVGMEERKKRILLSEMEGVVGSDSFPEVEMETMREMVEGEEPSASQFQRSLQVHVRTALHSFWLENKESDLFLPSHPVWASYQKADQVGWQHASEFWIRSDS